jgi:BASS family bile acid:Na+ symporter
MAAVFILMLAVGMDCTGQGLRKSATRPGLIAIITALQYLCIPALMFAVIFLLNLGPATATALILIGACPSGTISNAFTFLARGNTALSVTLTTVSNLVAFIATPLALALAGRFAGEEIAESLRFPPGPLLKQLLLAMVLPLALGFTIRNRFPEFVLKNLKPIRVLCILLILAVVALTVFSNPSEIGRQLKTLALPVLLITPLLFAFAAILARLFHTNTGEKKAVLFELPCRNVALAMLIALAVLERPDLAYVAMAFFMIETVMILILSLTLGRLAANTPGNHHDREVP